jgi:hypothetical protein
MEFILDTVLDNIIIDTKLLWDEAVVSLDEGATQIYYTSKSYKDLTLQRDLTGSTWFAYHFTNEFKGANEQYVTNESGYAIGARNINHVALRLEEYIERNPNKFEELEK